MSQTIQLDRLKKINSICEDFEARWRQNQSPRIEDYLDSADSEVQDDLLSELLRIELFYLIERGDEPDAHSYQKRFPGMNNGVIRAFDATRDAAASETQNQLPNADDLALRDIGQSIGPFKIEQILGRGAFAEVFLAFDKTQGRPVAVKAMKRFVDENGKPDARSVRTFVEEAETLSKLKHVAVARDYDLAYDDGFPYVILEYVKGDSLQFLLREEIIDLRTAIKLLADSADALSQIHQQDVFHRDLKPANIIVGLDGQPRIVDFGLAIVETAQHERKGEIAGSLSYMSPEQLRGQTHRLDGRTDIWSLGVMLYELLTERLPFRGGTRQLLIDEILHRAPRPPRQTNPKVTVGLEKVCLDALQKDSTKRIATAHDFAAALRDELGEFAERMADVSNERSRTAKGRAEMRLATQARFWTEKPETQRLPTLFQYINILTRTDPRTRTVAETKMMTAAFWLFSKRIAAAIVSLLVLAVWMSWFFRETKVTFTDREAQLQQTILDIGSCQTAAERRLHCEKIDNRDAALPQLTEQLSKAFLAKDVSAAENYLMALLDNSCFGSDFEQDLDSRHSRVRDILDTQQTQLRIPEVSKLIEDNHGMANLWFAFVPSVDAIKFETIHHELRKANYALVDIDFTQDNQQLAAVWRRFSNIRTFEDVKTVLDAKNILAESPAKQFDISNILCADFFSGDEGLDRLTEFEIRFVDMPVRVETRKERFERELKLADNYQGPRNGNYYFMRARANYYLGNYDQCLGDLELLSIEAPENLEERHVCEIAALVNARLGRTDKAVAKLKCLIRLSKAKVFWLLDLKDKAKKVLLRKSSFSQACFFSFIAEESNTKGQHQDAFKYLKRSREELEKIKGSSADQYYRYGLHVPDLDYLRRNAENLSEIFPLTEVLEISGKFSGIGQSPPSRLTGGVQPFAHSVHEHLKKARLLAAPDFLAPRSIEIVKDNSEQILVSSLWNKIDSEPLVLNTQLLAAAVAGSIKLDAMLGDPISSQHLNYLKFSNDQSLRTELIAATARLNTDVVAELIEALPQVDDDSIRQAVLNILSLCEREVLLKHQALILERVSQIETTNEDSGVNSSLLLLRNKMDQSKQIGPTKEPDSPAGSWYTNVVGQTMVKVGDFWMARTEVTESCFNMVVFSRQHDSELAERSTTFYQAAEYCNRLSELAGSPEDQWCYLPNDNGQYATGMKIKPNFQNLTGYRLPTAKEWQTAYKNGTTTFWEHGRNIAHTHLFENFQEVDEELTVAARLPNRIGLFDLGGNVTEWLTPDLVQVDTPLQVDDDTRLRLGGGYYNLGAKSTNRVLLESVAKTTSAYRNATGLRVVRKFRIK